MASSDSSSNSKLRRRYLKRKQAEKFSSHLKIQRYQDEIYSVRNNDHKLASTPPDENSEKWCN